MIKSLNYKRHTFLHKIVFLMLLLLCLFPIHKYAVISISTILFAFFSLINIKNEGVNKENYFHFFINTGFFFVLLITGFYSENFSEFLKEIQNSLSFIIFPLFIILFRSTLRNSQIRILLLTFLLANILMLVYWVYYFYQIEFFSDHNIRRVLTRFIFRKPLLNHPYVEWHPSYTGLWLGFCILIMVNYFSSFKSFWIKITLVLIVIIFYTAIFLLQARMPFIACSIAALILVFSRVNNRKSKFLFLTIISILLIIISLSISFNATLKHRYYNYFIEIKEGTQKYKRSMIYDCAINLISKEPIKGYGVGDVQDLLNECYKNEGFSFLLESEFNTHNNYFHFLMSGGMFLLLAFLITLCYNFRIAIMSKDYLYLSFLILIILGCLTENILSRVHGIVFFSFFNALLYRRNLQLSNSKKY